jgi:hypothetical protein
MFLPIYQIKRRHFSEDSNMNIYLLYNLEAHT